MLTPEDIERYKGHIASKERAREIIGKDIICCRIESKVSSDVLLAGVCFPLLSVPSKVP
jgi:thiamine monophosphate kinase